MSDRKRSSTGSTRRGATNGRKHHYSSGDTIKRHGGVCSTADLRKQLRNHGASVGGRVVNLFYVGAITCVELDNGFLIGAQVAKEHGNLEVVLANPEIARGPWSGLS
jgi:hypothetical protein